MMNSGPCQNTANFSSLTKSEDSSRPARSVLSRITGLLVLILLLSALPISSTESHGPELCLSPLEWQLFREVNIYRKNRGLPEIRLSAALTRVAQAHVADLTQFNPDTAQCNLHSWSGNGDWSPCCYTDDHARAKCMWDKPREISGYEGNGFEIAYWSSNGANDSDFARTALEAWKSSAGHHAVILNAGRWGSMKWNAIGVGISGGYACVWFGTVPDTGTLPGRCLP